MTGRITIAQWQAICLKANQWSGNPPTRAERAEYDREATRALKATFQSWKKP